ncbi:S41 family peptidase [Aerococcaceae bacterium zg-ZJ1578]|uniref:S41 family peptidase n=1 Tax=Aerococcaceae bacterium zg-252 TaxID=2796928 RepID=UPI001A25478D|nr:S41 family peptidase [Aerococcaceae bacterium zg-1578]
MNHNFFTHKKHFQQLFIILSLFLTFIKIDVFAEEQNEQSLNEFYADFMELLNTEAIHKDSQEWKEFYTNYLNNNRDYTSFSSLYFDLYDAVKIAGGKHSQLARADAGFEKREADFYEYPAIEELDNGIIHITIPSTYYFLAFAINEVDLIQSEEYQHYIETVLDYVRNNKDKIKGFIIDLRDNYGGFDLPMIQATHFLFNDGKLLEFVNADEEDSGYMELKQDTLIQSREEEYKLNIQRIEKIDVPVAILINQYTGSAGEFLCIMIKDANIENNKTFGENTGGFTSDNRLYRLPIEDNYYVNLTVGYPKSITGKIYKEEPIEPDVETETTLEDAIEWLNEMIKKE